VVRPSLASGRDRQVEDRVLVRPNGVACDTAKALTVQQDRLKGGNSNNSDDISGVVLKALVIVLVVAIPYLYVTNQLFVVFEGVHV